MKCKLDCFHCPYPDCIASGNRIIESGRSARALARKKEQYEKVKASGICVKCKKAIATHGIRCDACYKDQLIKQKELLKKKAAWRELGLCLKCGSIRAEGSEYCDRHTIMYEAYKEADRKRKRRGKIEATA